VDYREYTYRVTWFTDSNEYLGTCREFPSLSWIDTNAVRALTGIMQIIKKELDEWDDKEPPPTPRKGNVDVTQVYTFDPALNPNISPPVELATPRKKT